MVSTPASPSNRLFTFKDALQGFLIHEDLPFASILDSERIREIFRRHKSLFGGIYETSIVLWAIRARHFASFSSCDDTRYRQHGQIGYQPLNRCAFRTIGLVGTQQ